MTIHLPVMPRTHGAMVNEAAAWRQRALKAEAANVDLLAENGAQAGRIATLEQQRDAAADAAKGLRAALDRGAEKATPVLVDADLKRELDRAIAQLAVQAKALEAYEGAHHELNDALRTLAEERNAALATIERMSRAGAWNPDGVVA